MTVEEEEEGEKRGRKREWGASITDPSQGGVGVGGFMGGLEGGRTGEGAEDERRVRGGGIEEEEGRDGNGERDTNHTNQH